MYIDKRVFLIVMGIMLLMGIKDYLSSTQAILGLLYTIPGLLVAITFHEFAHAFVADKLGDDTPRNQGRLTLNPLAHLDPIGCVMLLFAGFGWGKPVQINPRNYDRRFTMEKADALVSIAGPAMNFILSIVFTIIFCIICKFVTVESQIMLIITKMIQYAVVINVGLGVFNLIPVPPLDGSKIIKPFLPQNIKNWFESNEQLFEMVFVALWIFGILSMIISPIISGISYGILDLGAKIFGIM